MIRIEGTDYHLYRDGDSGSFGPLTPAGMVAYMRGRVDLALITPSRAALAVSDHLHVGLAVATAIWAMSPEEYAEHKAS